MKHKSLPTLNVLQEMSIKPEREEHDYESFHFQDSGFVMPHSLLIMKNRCVGRTKQKITIIISEAGLF